MDSFQRHFWTPDNFLLGTKPDVPPPLDDLAEDIQAFWATLRRPWRVLALAEIRYPDQVADEHINQLRREILRTERIESDWLFIRRLERQGYPAIAFERVGETWATMQRQLPLTKAIRMQGDAFLAANQDLKQRLRAFGLYPEEREDFNMVTYGLFSDMVKMPRTGFRLPRRPQPYYVEDGVTVYHLPNELIVVSANDHEPLITSQFQPATGRTVINRNVNQDTLDRHLATAGNALDDRIRWLEISLTLASSITRLYTMGPVGFVLMGLGCLSRGLLRWDGQTERLVGKLQP